MSETVTALESLAPLVPAMTDWQRGFYNSVKEYYEKRGAVSEKQSNVLRDILAKLTSRGKGVALPNMQNIAALVQRAADKDVKRISISLIINPEYTIVLRYSAKHNKIFINDKRRNRENPHNPERPLYLTYGAISMSGVFDMNAAASNEGISAELITTLTTFDANPHKAGALQGRATGCCCFCSRRLETAESVHAGYGPICADRFGLPWGEGSNTNNVFNRVSSHTDLGQNAPIPYAVLLKNNLVGDEPISSLSRNTLLNLLS